MHARIFLASKSKGPKREPKKRGSIENISSKDINMELLEANAHFYNHQYAFIKSMSLKCAVQLGIPDAIHNHGRPMTLPELERVLLIHPKKVKFLPQLMQILTHSDIFYSEYLPNGGENELFYSLTSAGKFLLTDHPFSTKPYLLLVLDPSFLKPWADLSSWFQNEDETAFHTSHGMHMWEYVSCDPDLNQKVNQAMENDSKLIASALINTKLFEEIMVGVSSLVDVGGGFGAMAKAIANTFPHVNCIVLDQPHVVQGLKGSDNLTYVVGDMFRSIPPADAILLKWILHDWPDEECVKILIQCRKAITNKRNAKVLIIDVVMEEKQNKELKGTETQLLFDMEMLGMISGKERTEREWKKLFEDAGFIRGYKIHNVLGFRSLMELCP